MTTRTRTRTTRRLGTLAVLFAALGLVACGGGGGSSPTDLTTTNTPTADPVIPIPTTPPGGGTGGTDTGGGDTGGGDTGGTGGDSGGEEPQDPPTLTVPQPQGAPTNFVGVDTVHGIAVNAQDESVWMIDEAHSMLHRLEAGAVEPTPTSPITVTGVRGLAMQTGTTVLYALVDGLGGDDQIIAIDLQTFQETTIGTVSGYDQLESLAFHPHAGLVTVDPVTGTLVAISTTDATPSPIGALGEGYGDVRALTVDPETEALYGIDRTAAQVIAIDTTTGTATRLRRLGEETLDAMGYVASRGDFVMASAAGQWAGRRDLKGNDLRFPEVRDLAYDTNADVILGAHVAYGSVIEIDPTSSWRHVVAYVGLPDLRAIACDNATNHIHLLSSHGQRLTTLDRTTYATLTDTPLNGVGPTNGIQSMTMVNTSLYAIDEQNGDVLILTPGTGQALLQGSVGAGLQIAAMSHRDGVLNAYSNAQGREVMIDVQNPSSALPTVNGLVGPTTLQAMVWSELGPRLLGVDSTQNALIVIQDRTPEPAPTLGNIQAMVWDLVGNTLLAYDQDAQAFVHIENGTATNVALFEGAQIEGLAQDPGTGMSYSVDNATQTLRMIDGALEQHVIGGIGSLLTGNLRSLAWNPQDNLLYAVNGTRLVSIDPGLGLLTDIGETGYAEIACLTWDNELLRLLAIDQATGKLVTIDTGSGVAAEMGTVPSGTFTALTWHPTEHVLLAFESSARQVLRLDPLDGTLIPE